MARTWKVVAIAIAAMFVISLSGCKTIEDLFGIKHGKVQSTLNKVTK